MGPRVSEEWKQDVSREGAVRSKVAPSEGGHLVRRGLNHGKRPWAVWEASHPAPPPGLPQPCPPPGQGRVSPLGGVAG